MVWGQVWLRLRLYLVYWICRWAESFQPRASLADGVSECTATLDDSVSEEEEGSFDELTDVTPYLQPGVELSVLNEVRLRREACHIAAHAQKCVSNLHRNNNM